MRMPFGLDLKSILITLAVVYFVLPWVLGFINKNRTPAA